MTLPQPCHLCGGARQLNGLCPICEHLFCLYCYRLVSLAEYRSHCYTVRKEPDLAPLRERVWFWWEIAQQWPLRCFDCEAVLSPDRTCPNAVVAQEHGHPPRVSHPGLLDPGCQWVPLPF